MLSQRLTALLNSAAPLEEAAHAIAADPELRAEAVNVLEPMRLVAAHPAQEGGVKRVIGKRLSLYPQEERGDAEWAVWWDDYVTVCGGVPEDALEAGMRAWIAKADARFLPKPGELLALARVQETQAGRVYGRLCRAAAIHPPTSQATAPVPPPNLRQWPIEHSPEDRARVQRMAADAVARMHETIEATRPPVTMRPTHGPTDESGLTQAMREHLSSKGQRA